jgi:hypothetical protein
MGIIPEAGTAKTSEKEKTTYVTFADAQKRLLTALGYEEVIKDQTAEQIIAKGSELGLGLELKLAATKQITRGEAAVLIYNALTVDFAVPQ